MSGLREQLREQLERFDDDALAAFANRGLLRRAQKDLEKLAPDVIEESPETVVVGMGEHRIRFDGRGPTHAQCSCPASGVCQHVLAAMIALQRLVPDTAAVGTGQGTKEAAEETTAEWQPTAGKPAREAELLQDALAPLHAALLRMTPEEMVRHAGKPGYRWAWQFVHDQEPEAGPAISGSKYIVIRFSHPRVEFRYMGGGLDSMIAGAAIAQIEKYRVAAVLAYQRAHGVELKAPETSVKQRTAALDLGKDYAAPVAGHDLAESRRRLRQSVLQLIEECVELGLSHLSQGIHERFATLAVWAQGAEYFRLALLIRRLADHVELLLERAGGADEHRLLDEMALAYGLAGALNTAASNNAEPAHLLGRSRSQYEQVNTLELLGLGGRAWRSASGYVGLTMLFWSPKDGAFLSCTDARPETQRGFNPVARYHAAGPWGGLGAPAQATGKHVVLIGAQLSAKGRISAAPSTGAMVRPPESAARFAAMLQPCTDWAALAETRAPEQRSLLAEPQPMKDWVVLQPGRYGTAKFDPTRQVLVWPVFDAQDRRMDIELAYGDLTAHAIARMEQLRPEQLPVGTMLVAMLQNGVRQLVAEPLSLVRPHAAGGEGAVDALYFDDAPEEGFATQVRARLQKFASARTDATVAPEPPCILPQALLEVRAWTQRQAERGAALEAAGEAALRIAALIARTNAMGLTMFERVVANGTIPEKLLRMHYLCMQYETFFGGNSEGSGQ